MKLVSVFFLAAIVLATNVEESSATTLSTEQQLALVQGINKDIAPHAAHDPKFSELAATTNLAHHAKEGDKKQNLLAQVAAMTDAMIIQIRDEMDTLVKAEAKDVKYCRQKIRRYSRTIVTQKLSQGINHELAEKFVRQIKNQMPKIPQKRQQMRSTDRNVKNSLDNLGTAILARKKGHEAFLANVDEIDTAINDIRNIRLILANSALNNRASTHKGLTELQPTVHYKLASLVQLAIAVNDYQEKGKHASRSTDSMDRIYELLYKTRDELIATKNAAIKEEIAAVNQWKNRKIGMQNAINNLRVLYHVFYKNIGDTKELIGAYKRSEGITRKVKHVAIARKERAEIFKDFLETDCEERRLTFQEIYAVKKEEKEALKAVQKKLKSLKWSAKAFEAVQSINQGVNYLRGEYNIRSALNRYMVLKEIPTFESSFTPAGKFQMRLNKQDLSYSIITYFTKGKKKLKMYLTEDKSGAVVFRSRGGANSRWNIIYDDKTNYAMFIRNKITRNTLYVDPKQKYRLTTTRQSSDAHSMFSFEKPVYSQIACYKNKIGKDLSFYAGARNGMHTDLCLSLCIKKNPKFTHFGLTEGKQCMCGNSWHKALAERGDCTMTCDKRTGELCGGTMRTIVYSITKKGKKKPSFVAEPPILVNHKVSKKAKGK